VRKINKNTSYIIVILLIAFFQCSTVKTIKHKNLCRFNDPYINQTIVNAWENFHKSRFEWAALDFTRLIQKNYIDYDILFGAGLAYFFMNDTAKALDYFTQAINKNPYHFEAYYLRAKIYLQMGNKAKAKDDCLKIVSMGYPNMLICGYYYNNNDIADTKALQARKKEAQLLLAEIDHD